MKKIAITGVAGGLGSCVANRYLSRGNLVFGFDICISRSAERMMKEYPESFLFSFTDVRSESSIDDAAEFIIQRTEELDILYNNAAILPSNSGNLLENFDIDASLDVFSTNALGPLRMVKKLLSLMKRGEDKIIVNISSEAGSMTTHCDYVNRFDYCMSKAALNIQSIILQRYLKKDGIKVLAVHPGWMRTQMGGPDAPLLPEESAGCIIELVDRCKHNHNAGIYFNYDGSERPW